MSNLKHTPGPWKVQRQNPSPTTGEWMIAGGLPGYLAEVRDCGSGDVTANAALIASAPDLLAALRDAEAALAKFQYEDPIPPSNEWVSDIRRKALLAIAKATGGQS